VLLTLCVLESPGDVVKMQDLVSRSRMGPRICISHKLSGIAGAAAAHRGLELSYALWLPNTEIQLVQTEL
jgi:hypothetical protein